jgi:hypothetical protein
VLEVAGYLLWAVALRSLWVKLREPIGIYDEGILLTDAEMVLAGKVAYRDFYTNYPPGVFLMLAGLFKLFGSSILVERGAGLLGRVACGVLAGAVAGRLSGARFSAVAAGLVTLWLATIGTMAFAYVLAVPVALGAVLLFLRAREQGSRGAYVWAGLVLGLVSWLRHDLFAVMAVVAGAGGVFVAVKQKAWSAEARKDWGWVGWLVLGTALAVVPFWLPWLALAGPKQVMDDLYFDQVRYTMPGRVLPLPNLFALGDESGLPLPLPALLRSPLEGAVTLTLLGPVLALLALLWPGRDAGRGRLGAALMGVVSLAVLPQMMGRTDIWHAVYTVPPAALLVGVWVNRLSASGSRPWGRGAVAVAAFLLVLWPARAHLMPAPGPDAPNFPGLARANELPCPIPPIAESRRAVLSFIQENSRPGEPIYVGVTDHRFIFVNEMELYFVADRIGATRYMQFDPNVINRLDVQEQMARELDAAGVRVVVLSGLVAGWDEPNDIRKQGADFLDRYLKENFEVVREVPPYVLMLRRPPAGSK